MNRDELHEQLQKLKLHYSYFAPGEKRTHALDSLISRWNAGDAPKPYKYTASSIIRILQTPKGVLFVRID